jgi:hypothetical protein
MIAQISTKDQNMMLHKGFFLSKDATKRVTAPPETIIAHTINKIFIVSTPYLCLYYNACYWKFQDGMLHNYGKNNLLILLEDFA